MTLQRFLVSVAESRVAWMGRTRWRPAPSARFGPGVWLAQTAAVASFGLVPGLLMVLLLGFHPLLRGGWWPIPWCLTLGAAVGGVSYGLVAVAWNRRASELAQAGASEPSPLPTPRWWQRWILAPSYAVLCFGLTPLVLVLSVDNAVGTRQWRREQASRSARGEPSTPAELRGPAPTDAENFAMAPLIRATWEFRTEITNGRREIVWKDPANRARMKCLAIPAPFRPPSDTSKDRQAKDGRVSLDAVARGIRATPLVRPEALPDDLARRFGTVERSAPRPTPEEVRALVIPDPAGEVLDYLKRFEPELTEIAEAAGRPRSRFGLDWDVDVLLPHLSTQKSLNQTYRIRAVARLAKGDVSGAFEDVRLGFRLAETSKEDPIVIAHLVRIAQFSIATSAAWEGMVEHRWNEAQLAELQDRFARIDVRESLVEALRGEAVFGLRLYDRWLGGDGAETEVGEGSPFPPLTYFAPRGVYRRNQIHHARAFDRLIAQVRDPAWPHGVPMVDEAGDRDRRFLDRLGLLPRTPNNILPAMQMPALRKLQATSARMHTTARLAEVACALERFRVRNGAYPERLAALVPTFLATVPNDPMSGQTPLYRRADDGGFALWSVGPNRRDDGGETKPARNDEEGDWVWPTPVPRVGPRLF
ncbi:MAG: hypothetical protein JNL97_04050 [Verrucomicrobiales bacterium]|nr:hypothetical protein [Verrucomicrobiales bacterium]